MMSSVFMRDSLASYIYFIYAHTLSMNDQSCLLFLDPMPHLDSPLGRQSWGLVDTEVPSRSWREMVGGFSSPWIYHWFPSEYQDFVKG